MVKMTDAKEECYCTTVLGVKLDCAYCIREIDKEFDKAYEDYKKGC